MEIIYKKIIDSFNDEDVQQVFIDRSLPLIKQIDINYGQPENPEAFEVFLPGIYVSWNISELQSNEPNLLTLDFHVLQEPGAHTENYSTRLTEGYEYILMLKTIKYILNKLRASNTTGLKYIGERPNVTPFFRYHILSYQCFVDKVDDSFTKGSTSNVELLDMTLSGGIKYKETQLPTDIDTF